MTAPGTIEPASVRRAIPDGAAESLWRAPDGHEIRRIDLVTTGDSQRGSLLFMPGRGDFYEKYLETLDFWAGQGWSVTAADWRGQAYSGRLGGDEHTGHIDDFSLWIDDIATFWAHWKAETPGPHVIVGHSMGGHLVLRALAEVRIDPEAAVLAAPMLGIVPSMVPDPVLHGFAKVMAVLRGRDRSAWGGSEKSFRLSDDRIELLTHDAGRYEDEKWWRRERPELAMGPPSWGWIERAYASNRLLRKRGVLEKIATPILFLATRHDRLVDARAITAAAGRVPDAKLIMFGDEARHEILREEDAVRNTALDTINDFLAEAAPVPVSAA